MDLDVEITDLSQGGAVSLDYRRVGGSVGFALNGGRTASFEISREDSQAANALANYAKLLRVTLNGPGAHSEPVFIGPITTPIGVHTPDGEGIIINALDSMHRLENAAVLKTDGVLALSSDPFVTPFDGLLDYSAIMDGLVAHVADHGTGIISGSQDASTRSSRAYGTGANVAEQLVALADAYGAPDFDLKPVVAGGGTIAHLDTHYPQMGTDKTGTVIFKHGQSPFTAREFSYEPSAPMNEYVAVGQAASSSGSLFAPAYRARATASISAYGKYQKIEGVDTSTPAVLEAVAKAQVAANAIPVKWFTFTSMLEKAAAETGDGVPPVFAPAGDYWIGDAIKLVAGTSAPLDNLRGRVVSGALTETEGGQLQAEVTCAPAIDTSLVSGGAINVCVWDTSVGIPMILHSGGARNVPKRYTVGFGGTKKGQAAGIAGLVPVGRKKRRR